MKLNDLKIGKRLWLTFSMLVLMTVFVGGAGIYNNFLISGQANTIAYKSHSYEKIIVHFQIRAANGHLWLEEILSGDKGEDIEEVWQELAEADSLLRLLENGGVNNGEKIEGVRSIPEVLRHVRLLRKKLKNFIHQARFRYKSSAGATGVGSQSDQEFDKLYGVIQKELKDINTLFSPKKDPETALKSGEARFLLADGHLLLEEYIAGDLEVKVDEVKSRFFQALEVVKKLESSVGRVETLNLKQNVDLLLVALAQRLRAAAVTYSVGSEIDQKFDEAFNLMIAESEEVERFFGDRSKNILSHMNATVRRSAFIYSLLIFSALLVASLVGLSVIRSIVQPILPLVDAARRLALGELPPTVKISGNDELTGLSLSFNTLIRSTSEVARHVGRVAAGDFSVSIKERSNKDQLSSAVNSMTVALKEKSVRSELNDWVKEGFNLLLGKLMAEKSFGEILNDVISFLAFHLEAQVGTFYVMGDNGSLELKASYAFVNRKSIKKVIREGEGIVGQAICERSPIVISEIPEDYIVITSSLGHRAPRSLVAIPAYTDTEILGAFELGSLSTFSQWQIDFLVVCASTIATKIKAMKQAEITDRLLVKTREQAESLQTQQEELRNTNDNLLEQTQRLQASEEELREQGEELRVSNEELEEKQKYLTEQKNQIETSKNELEIKAAELALASRYKSEFLANMSHEFRTPLNSLLLLSKGLADNKKGHLDDTEVEDARVIYDGGNSLLSLINDIMDLSKVEAGKLHIHIEDVRIDTITGSLQKIFNPVADDRGLNFKIEVAANLPLFITSDGQRVAQILKNLLSNAMKFTENGSVTLKVVSPESSVKFTDSTLSAESAIAFIVTDTGIGIPADKQKAIFEAFQQQDGSTSRQYGGTGLGLAISRELTRILGGEIHLESALGEGSTFTLYLPDEVNPESIDPVRRLSPFAAQTGEKPIKNHRRPPLALKSTPQRSIQYIPDDREDISEGDRTLLIIDDDKKFARILRDHGRSNGYKCLVAGDGRTGIYLAQEYGPLGIILDIGLPDIDGHQVLEQLKFSLKTRHIPVQIISAFDGEKSRSMVQGAIGFLEKPVREEQLNSVLTEIAEVVRINVTRILVVEDSAASRQAITRLLENNNIEIKCAGTGKEGCVEILSGQYDCVILDLGLPDMTGFDVLKSINEKKSGRIPPVIIYTGREITDAEQAELDKYSSTIVIKGAGSPERLLDDVSLFMHNIESRLKNESQKTIRMLHDEDAMLKDRKILLVDDDMRNTYALSKKLIDVGFDVEMAKNGKDAVEMLEKKHSFELVLMDTMMPVMDGNKATELIRKMHRYKDLPVIALTAKTMPEDRDQCLRAGASEYLAKPVDFEKLLSVMRIWLFKSS